MSDRAGMTMWQTCWAVMAGLLSGLVMTCPAVVMARDYLTQDDVVVLYRPEPARYTPDSDRDMRDQGKSFEVTCTISRSGRMTDCRAQDNDMADQNFVRIAVQTVSQWVVGPQTRDGESSEGRILVVRCQFQLQGAGEGGERHNNGRVASR